jgi:hypothetical protein
MDETFIILPHGYNNLRDFLHYLNSVDDMGLKTPGICNIPWECYQVYSYIEQTNRSSASRPKEHHQQVHLEHPEKSVMEKHIINFPHRILLHHTTILSTKPRYMDHIIGEAVENELLPNKMNRDVGF